MHWYVNKIPLNNTITPGVNDDNKNFTTKSRWKYCFGVKSFPSNVTTLIFNNFLPIVCPIGLDEDYHGYNINADDAASAIAEAVKAEKLAFLTDTEGVYMDKDDSSTVISEMTVSEAEKLIEDGIIAGGMLPKIKNCMDAIKNGVSRVHILDGRIPHSILLEIFTNKGVGTAILDDEQEKFYTDLLNK